jgi:replicative DNA helicase
MSENSKSMFTAVDSERAALGSVLLDNRHLSELLAHTPVDQFSLDWHREILRVMASLTAQKKAVDLTTVVEELQRTGKLESMGGPDRISELIMGVPERPNIETYLRNIRDAARTRTLHAALSSASIALEQGEALDDVLFRLQEKQQALARAQTSRQKLFLAAPQFIAQAPKASIG